MPSVASITTVRKTVWHDATTFGPYRPACTRGRRMIAGGAHQRQWRFEAQFPGVFPRDLAADPELRKLGIRRRAAYHARMGTPIYLDHNATTPVLPAVVEAMRSCYAEPLLNPA